MMSRAAVLLWIALLGTAGRADGQQGVRSGLWLEGSVGTGTVRNGCGGCPGVTSGNGGTDYLRAGHSVAPRVLVGVELFALGASDLVLGTASAPVDTEKRSIGPMVMWYVGRSGFFLRGGAGLARGTFNVRTAAGETVTTKRTGSSLTYGIGFDIGVLPWVALTASLGSNVMAIGNVTVDATVVDDIIATIYEVGVGVTLR
jgi:hypothetical protein